jgi:hypothetical protein
VLLITLAISAVILVEVQPARADSTYYDATNSLIDLENPLGTQWHELYPIYCQGPYELVGWRDNGDSMLSYCDTIDMQPPGGGNPETQHVIVVTYTLELTPIEPPVMDHFWDFTTHDLGGDPIYEPVCSWWHEVYPEFCVERHIDYWEDNGTQKLDSCDVIVDNHAVAWHVEGVHTDIVTEPVPGTATDQSTWSKIKALFR